MFSIRFATPDDVSTILDLIRKLALYERAPDAVIATEADLLRDGFGSHPHFECLIAEVEEPGAGSRAAGFALYFRNYSTWRGRPGIHLEDLFVLPEFRRRGIARRLLAQVASRAVEQGYDRLNLHVLEWNQPAIDFYRRLGADCLSEWQLMRITHGLASLAKEPR